MEIKLNISQEDLSKLEEFRLLFVNDAIKRKDQYQVDTWNSASIEKLVGYYLTSKLQKW